MAYEHVGPIRKEPCKVLEQGIGVSVPVALHAHFELVVRIGGVIDRRTEVVGPYLDIERVVTRRRRRLNRPGC